MGENIDYTNKDAAIMSSDSFAALKRLAERSEPEPHAAIYGFPVYVLNGLDPKTVLLVDRRGILGKIIDIGASHA